MPTVTAATVTAKAGPALQNTAVVLSGINSYAINLQRQVIQLFNGDINSGPYKEFDLTGVTTFTTTISGGNYSITIS